MVLLFAFWLLLNGRITVEVVALGLLICAAMYGVLNKTLGFSYRWEIQLWKKAPQAILYLLKLVWAVIVAGMQTMVLTLSPAAKEVAPRLVYIKRPVQTKIGTVVLANSITLTPGTITCGVGKDTMCIHALDAEFAKGLDTSDFVKDIRKMEGNCGD